MPALPTLIRTPLALRWLAARDPALDRLQRALLATIDGHRNVIELESVARAMGLEPDALDRLRRQGLVELDAAAGSSPSRPNRSGAPVVPLQR